MNDNEKNQRCINLVRAFRLQIDQNVPIEKVLITLISIGKMHKEGILIKNAFLDLFIEFKQYWKKNNPDKILFSDTEYFRKLSFYLV